MVRPPLVEVIVRRGRSSAWAVGGVSEQYDIQYGRPHTTSISRLD
jgi:hypothetical protein